MSIGNYIDIVLILYFLFSIVVGFRQGLIKTLFVSFGFLLKAFITFFVYTMFSKQLLAEKNISYVINMIRDTVIKFMPNLKIVSGIVDTIILVLLIYFVASVVLVIIFRLIKNITDSDMLSMTDKFLGSIFALVKALLVVMFIAYAMDKVSDYAITKEMKEGLSHSLILQKIYFYNIFMSFPNMKFLK